MDSTDWEGRSKMERIHNVSVKALNLSARKLFGRIMDPPRMTFSRKGLQQDWEGLAELMDLDIDEIQTLAHKEEKTVRLLEQWSQKPNSTIGRLIMFIEQLERYDILEHAILQARILADVEAYKKKQEVLKNSSLSSQPIQDDSVTSSPPFILQCSPQGDIPIESEFKNITVGEVETGRPEYFEAFVCYSHEDITFVKQMISMLEDRHGLKLCIKDRDIIPGSAKDTIVAHLISQRCKKMIIVLSPRFLRCSECDFMTKFGHSLAPGARNKKLIPIMIQQPCPVPDILRYITQVDYTKCELVEWFWWRVARSLQESSYIDLDTLYGRHIASQHGLQIQEVAQGSSAVVQGSSEVGVTTGKGMEGAGTGDSTESEATAPESMAGVQESPEANPQASMMISGQQTLPAAPHPMQTVAGQPTVVVQNINFMPNQNLTGMATNSIAQNNQAYMDTSSQLYAPGMYPVQAGLHGNQPMPVNLSRYVQPMQVNSHNPSVINQSLVQDPFTSRPRHHVQPSNFTDNYSLQTISAANSAQKLLPKPEENKSRLSKLMSRKPKDKAKPPKTKKEPDTEKPKFF